MLSLEMSEKDCTDIQVIQVFPNERGKRQKRQVTLQIEQILCGNDLNLYSAFLVP